MAKTNLRVGQKLFFVSSGSDQKTREVTVNSVGRKWAELSNFCRIDIKTFVADGGKYDSPGKCFINIEEYVDKKTAMSEFHRLRNEVYACKFNESVTAEDIREIRSFFVKLGLI